jgi:hypothetical protein
MLQRMIVGVMVVSALGAASVIAKPRLVQSTVPPDNRSARSQMVIQDYAEGLAGACTSRPGVRLSVGTDSAINAERLLLVEYPAPTNDPAGRDTQCAAKSHDWTVGHAIAFQIKPDHPLRLSVSFVDRHRVVYTAPTELKAGVWQLVRMPFAGMRPNPYFQFPDARTGMPIDVSDVTSIAFAPQDQTSGRLAIGPFVLSQ